MSWQAVRSVLERSQSKGTTRLVLLVIAEHADKHGRNARLRHGMIVKEANASLSTVKRAITCAEKLGELAAEPHAGGSSTYALTMPATQATNGLPTQANGDLPPRPTVTPLIGPVCEPSYPPNRWEGGEKENFKHWQQAFGTYKAAPSPARLRYFTDRRKTFSDEQLRVAISVAASIDWWHGTNDHTGKPLCEPWTLLKNDDVVRGLLALTADPNDDFDSVCEAYGCQ